MTKQKIERVILLRHGLTSYNREKRIQGASEVPILPEGIRQAETAAKLLQKEPFLAVVSSPISRAKDTAEIVVSAVNAHSGKTLRVQNDERLVERHYGLFEGKTLTEVAQEFPKEYKQWVDYSNPQGVGVETRTQCAKRGTAAIMAAIAKGDEELNSCRGDVDQVEQPAILVVSHGSIITATIERILGIPDSGMWRGIGSLENCHWVEIRKNRQGINPQWRIVAWNKGK